MALLTEAQVQIAFDWLLENGDAIGAARGMQIRTTYRVQKTRAKLLLRSPETSDVKRKAWAESHDEYEEACEAHAQAEAEWEKLKDHRNKAELIIEAWRSICANERGIRKIG